MTEILEVSCDEAGHTGPDLLQAEQRFFGFGSVTISDDEAWSMIQTARRQHPIQMQELKSSKLVRSRNGCALIAELVEAAEGRYAFNVYDKLLALGGWLFEYIYEPVFQRDPWLLYKKNLHRFVAMFCWLWFKEIGSEATEAIRQFQKYMRSQDEADAPLLFARIQEPLSDDGHDHPFELVLRFARGYRNIILADNSRLDTTLPDGGRWVLDLSTSALWSHLNHWGKTGKSLRVLCDASKPLQNVTQHFTGDDSDPGIVRARQKQHDAPLGWKLTEPVSFVDSRDHPAIQLADVVAGTAVAHLMRGVPAALNDTIDRMYRHILPDTILPDMANVDLSQRAPAVNYLVLYDLAKRAEQGSEPNAGLSNLYEQAEISWARGNFKFDN